MPATFEYVFDTTPNTPFPLFMGWGLFADLHGQQAFQAPIRAYRGTVNAPSYTFADENRTGWFQPWPNSIGAAIAGFLRFYIDEEGTAYLNYLNNAGKIKADLLTQDQSYQLPDRSGIIALDTIYQKTNNEAFAIQAGQPVRLDGAAGCRLAVSTSYSNSGVGVAEKTTAAGAEVYVRDKGLVELADWTNVTGTVNLTVNAEYFLGSVAGTLTENPIDTTGYVLQYFGRAITPTMLNMNVQRGILL